MKNLSISIQNFNNRVKQMNQTNSKQLILTSEEARNLHTDIFNLLASLTSTSNKPSEPINIDWPSSLDGGGFK